MPCGKPRYGEERGQDFKTCHCSMSTDWTQSRAQHAPGRPSAWRRECLTTLQATGVQSLHTYDNVFSTVTSTQHSRPCVIQLKVGVTSAWFDMSQVTEASINLGACLEKASADLDYVAHRM